MFGQDELVSAHIGMQKAIIDICGAVADLASALDDPKRSTASDLRDIADGFEVVSEIAIGAFRDLHDALPDEAAR